MDGQESAPRAIYYYIKKSAFLFILRLRYDLRALSQRLLLTLLATSKR